MRLSEFSDEKALEVLADLIEPAAEIMADKAIKEAYEAKNAAHAISVAIKNHKRAVISILATLDGTPVEEYHVNVFTLPAKLLEILNDPELTRLFTLQGQTGDAKSSGSASEKTE